MAIGTPFLMVREDVKAAVPGWQITPPTALDRALREDKGMRLVHRVGKLELFALRGHRPGGLDHLVRHRQLRYAGSARPGAASRWERADNEPDAVGRSRDAAGSACFTMAARRRQAQDLVAEPGGRAITSSCCPPPARSSAHLRPPKPPSTPDATGKSLQRAKNSPEPVGC